MATARDPRRARLSIYVEPELRRKIKMAAAEKDLTVRDYVVTVLQRALASEGRAETAANDAWARLSVGSFARDWDSEEDRVYDLES
ncbi:MAG TPA: hypothetical protein VEQ11_01545 [Chloroflexota bacterium]|nr:hypothetical protein [Chloroflexota bacterium]